MHCYSLPASLFRRDQPGLRRRSSVVIRSALLVALLAFVLGIPRAAAQAPSSHAPSVQASDLYRMQTVRDLALSPTGRFVAYTVRAVHTNSDSGPKPKAAHRTHLYVTATSGREPPQRLTRRRNGARQPAWHPDGTHLAFVRPVNETPQVFILSLSGGEPYQLTDVPYGVQNPQWSPNGERLLFTSRVPPSAVPQRSSGAETLPGGARLSSERPGRAPGDLVRTPPPDTVIVLRDRRTLDAVDTLTFDPQGRLRLPTDTTQILKATPRDSLARRVMEPGNTLSTDSLLAALDSLHLLPDTTALPIIPDTAATPDGNLVQRRRWLNQNRTDGTAFVSTRLDLRGKRGFTPTPTYRHYFVVSVPDNLQSSRPSRPMPQAVTHGYRTFGRADWLPGSSQIVVSGTPPSSRHIDRIRRRTLYVADLNRDRVQRLLQIENYALTAPNVTSDGTKVAFQAQSLAEFQDAQTEVGLFALDGRSAPRILSSTLDRNVRTIRWSPEGWYLYATAPSRGGVPIYRFTPFAADTSATPSMSPDLSTSRDTFALDSTMIQPASYRQMTASSRSIHDVAVTTASAVYAASGPDSPSALYTNTVSFNNETQISAPNADWVSRRHLAEPNPMTVRSGSLAIDGWITRPIPFADSMQYPLVIRVRGGPQELDALNASEEWFERQYLAAHGFAVLEVLPRGSSGYGLSFRRANDGNWGPGPAQDVIALADSAASLPWIDASRQALVGTSYGGTLTAWMIGQTDRFDAAVALNGAYDLSALLDAGPLWQLGPQEFGGHPWEGAPNPPTDSAVFSAGLVPSFDDANAPWRRVHQNSPITFVDQMDTPLLLLEGKRDVRTGPTQAERLYKRLKILDRPVEYVYYPGVGHDVARTAAPAQRLDRVVRTQEFLVRFLSPPRQIRSPKSGTNRVP